MKSDTLNGYLRTEIFKDEEEENKIMNMKALERETIIAERVEKLNHEKERKKLLNEIENKSKETKKSKLYDKEQSSEELGEIKEPKGKSRHKKSYESNGDNDESEVLSVDNEDDKQIKKETDDITLEDIKKIVLNRTFFEKYYFYPNFDDMVKGAFVRVNLSSTVVGHTNYMGYSIFEILQIVTKDKSYDFAGNKCNKRIKFKNFNETVTFKIISNSEISDDEFQKLKNTESTHIPTKEEIEKIQKNIDEIRNKKLTPDELNVILTKKRKDRIKYKDSTLNVTEELGRTIEQYRALKEEYDDKKEELSNEEKENYIQKMKELDDDIKQLEKMKEERDRKAKFYSENDIVAKINEDIKEKRKLDERMSLLAKKRRNAANEKENSLFRRVDCHPSNLIEGNKSSSDGLELVKKYTSEYIENKNKKKEENNFSYAKKIRKFKEFIESKKNLIEEMMENENKKLNNNNNKEQNDKNEINLDEKEDINKKDIKDNKQQKQKQNLANIDMSLFFKLANINYDSYNKMIKDQNKQNTKDPEIKILGFDEYLNEYIKQ